MDGRASDYKRNHAFGWCFGPPQTVQVLITREVTNEDGSLIIITESAELPNGYTYEPPKKPSGEQGG